MSKGTFIFNRVVMYAAGAFALFTKAPDSTHLFIIMVFLHQICIEDRIISIEKKLDKKDIDS